MFFIVQSSPEEAKSDDDMEFMIIRDEFSPEPERPSKVNIPARLDDVEVPDDEVVDAVSIKSFCYGPLIIHELYRFKELT